MSEPLSRASQSKAGPWRTQVSSLAAGPFFVNPLPDSVLQRAYLPEQTALVYGVGCMRCLSPSTAMPLDAIGFHLAQAFAARTLGLDELHCIVCHKLSEASEASHGKDRLIEAFAARHMRLAERVKTLLANEGQLPRLQPMFDRAIVEHEVYGTVSSEHEQRTAQVGSVVGYAAQQIRTFETFRRLSGKPVVIKSGWSVFRSYPEFERSRAKDRLSASFCGTSGACELVFDQWMDDCFPGFLFLYCREARAFTSNAPVCGPYTAELPLAGSRHTRILLGENEPLEQIVLDPGTPGKKRKWQEMIIEAIEGLYRLSGLFDLLFPGRLPVRDEGILQVLTSQRNKLLEELKGIEEATGSTAGPGYAKRSALAHQLSVERARLLRQQELPRIGAILQLFSEC